MSGKLAEVVELTAIGTAKVKFEGEESPSEKEYPYYRSYVPRVGDKVHMVEFNGSYIIADAISHEIAPDDVKSYVAVETNKLRDEINGVKNDYTKKIDLEKDYTKKVDLEKDYTKTTDLEKNYLQISNFGSQIDNHTAGKGRRLVRSNVTSGSTYNIDYLYIEPSTKKLHVRTVWGTWYSFNP